MEAMDFKRASHAVWEAMAQGWGDRHAYFEETARPVAEGMLQRLAPAPGQAILELAAGTGVVGFAAALVGSGGRVIVSDFSEAMVAVAERRAAELRLENVGAASLTRSGWSSLTRLSTACFAAGGTC
jgi:enediyne biosynthesis protein CalE5